MKENIEIEYKTLLSKNNFFTLLDMYKSDTDYFVKQDNYYYDTSLFDCKNNNIAIRTRVIADETYFTLKFKADVLYEYEKKVSCCFLNDREVLDILSRYNIDPKSLINFATLSTERCQIDLNCAYLCFDINTYNDSIDYELEYEYKNAEASLNDYQSILSKVGCSFSSNCDSKIARVSKNIKIQ